MGSRMATASAHRLRRRSGTGPRQRPDRWSRRARAATSSRSRRRSTGGRGHHYGLGPDRTEKRDVRVPAEYFPDLGPGSTLIEMSAMDRPRSPAWRHRPAPSRPARRPGARHRRGGCGSLRTSSVACPRPSTTVGRGCRGWDAGPYRPSASAPRRTCSHPPVRRARPPRRSAGPGPRPRPAQDAAFEVLSTTPLADQAAATPPTIESAITWELFRIKPLARKDADLLARRPAAPMSTPPRRAGRHGSTPTPPG